MSSKKIIESSKKSIKHSRVVHLIVLLFLIGGIIYERLRVRQRYKSEQFTSGKIIGVHEGAKGSRYVDYVFYVEGVKYQGSVNVGFCIKCKYECCIPGVNVTVRYAKTNPKNNDLVEQE